MYQYIDATSLSDNETWADIEALLNKTVWNGQKVASVCVYPKWLRAVAPKLDGEIHLATVVNFPDGNQPLKQSVTLTKKALFDGADEIDVVMPYQALKAGKYNHVFNYLRKIVRLVHSKRGTVKVILETGALTPEEIEMACYICLALKVDFIKTSTGKIAVGATEEAVEIILKAIGDNAYTGLKISGGIRDVATAERYLTLLKRFWAEDKINPDYFRIGTSALINDIQKSGQSSSSY